MTASQQCKQAGLKSLAELAQITGRSIRTLQEWHKTSPMFFKIVLYGAIANAAKDESGVAQRSELQPFVKRFVALTGEYHADCNALYSRIAELENALDDAKLFANYIECLGRTDCEIYKHELKSSADLSLSRIDSAIGV